MPLGEKARSGHGGRHRKEIIIACVIFALLAILCGGIGAVYLYSRSHNPTLDPTTLCPTNRPPEGVTAILLDTTDSMSSLQEVAVRAELENLRRAVPRHGALEIYRVGITQAGVHSPVFKACNPGSPQDINPLIESERRAKKRWENEFKAPLDEAFKEWLSHGEASNSPIIESLQAVGSLAFASNELDDVPKKLVIVSDMLQNTPALNHYQSNFDYPSWHQSRGTGAPIAHLTDVKVDIFYLTRPGTPQGAKHVGFWEGYFSGQGAQIERVKRIPR